MFLNKLIISNTIGLKQLHFDYTLIILLRLS